MKNDLITSPDDGCLIGVRHADKNDVTISGTMLRYLAPPQLRPMADNHRIMCGCAICNTSTYFQKSLNAWRQKQLKIMKYKADNLCGRKKDELTQAYKSYADYDFPNNETHHPRYENPAYYVICTPTNDECQLTNWKCVLCKCTACTYIALPGVERYSSKRAPIITFNTCMTQFTCSHHGILIREKLRLIWMQKEHLKILVSYMKN